MAGQWGNYGGYATNQAQTTTSGVMTVFINGEAGATFIQIVAGCCQNVAVQNLSTVPIEMVDASINFDREGVSVLGVM